jgi:hypothetical protein
VTVRPLHRAPGAIRLVEADTVGSNGMGNERRRSGPDDPCFAWLFDASVAPPSRPGLGTIPRAAETGWSPVPTPRRLWIARGVLLGILLVQAALSLRLRNGAFEDEALYLYAGHLEIAHLLNGTSAPGFASFFSGSPVLYPVLAAAVDAVFGLGGARALSLLFMLGATASLYALTRLLFNERAALCAVAIFAVCPSTIFMGNLATYDAAAVFLLALASWIVIRTRHRTALVTCLLAAPVLALVVTVKYASLLFVPTVVALAVLAAFPGRGWPALSRAVLLPVLTGACLVGALLVAGADAWQGVRTTTTARAAGTDRLLDLLEICAWWAGPPLAVAAVGAVLYVWRDRMGEVPDLRVTVSRKRWWRILLALLLCGSAVLAPTHHMQLHTAVSLHKHIGYGLLFAAPLAGVGLSRVVGAHFRHPQFGILIWVAVLMSGITLSRELYLSWPDPHRLVAALQPELAPGKRYLVENSWPPQYYLRDQTEPWQWTSTYAISYPAGDGRALSGREGYVAALDAGHFDVIVLDGSRTPALDKELIAKLRLDPRYRLLGVVPHESWTGTGNYRIWVKNPA